jgi:hypothetical protein
VHNEEITEYPEEAKADYLRLSEWVRMIQKAHGNRVQIRIVDPQSLFGFWKVLRHRIRRFPTFFVSGERIPGWEGNPDAAIARTLARREASQSYPTRT